ncbi:hypothetical protein Hanom_Chr13g01198741 [Helianthus anomalus]
MVCNLIFPFNNNNNNTYIGRKVQVEGEQEGLVENQSSSASAAAATAVDQVKGKHPHEDLPTSASARAASTSSGNHPFSSVCMLAYPGIFSTSFLLIDSHYFFSKSYKVSTIVFHFFQTKGVPGNPQNTPGSAPACYSTLALFMFCTSNLSSFITNNSLFVYDELIGTKSQVEGAKRPCVEANYTVMDDTEDEEEYPMDMGIDDTADGGYFLCFEGNQMFVVGKRPPPVRRRFGAPHPNAITYKRMSRMNS